MEQGGCIGRTLTEGLADKYKLTLFIRNAQPDTSRNLKIVKANLSKEEKGKGVFEELSVRCGATLFQLPEEVIAVIDSTPSALSR